MATPFVLGIVIELLGDDAEMLSIKDWVRSGSSYEA